MQASNGNLYGTTAFEGQFGLETIFSVSSEGNFQTIHRAGQERWERFSQKGWGAQPPRLLFGAPRAELCTTRTTIQRRAPRRNANGEGAVGSARGGRAPRFQRNR